MTLTPGMLDYDLRVRRMDQAGVDLAIVSLTCPNVFWGEAETSLEAARATNDDMAAAQRAWPDRIRWLASLPWQHPKLALAELGRALDAGAVGVSARQYRRRAGKDRPVRSGLGRDRPARATRPVAPDGAAGSRAARHDRVQPQPLVRRGRLRARRAGPPGRLRGPGAGPVRVGLSPQRRRHGRLPRPCRLAPPRPPRSRAFPGCEDDQGVRRDQTITGGAERVDVQLGDLGVGEEQVAERP
jgi:hypothetical protein